MLNTILRFLLHLNVSILHGKRYFINNKLNELTKRMPLLMNSINWITLFTYLGTEKAVFQMSKNNHQYAFIQNTGCNELSWTYQFSKSGKLLFTAYTIGVQSEPVQ